MMEPISISFVVERNQVNLARRNDMRAFGLWLLGVPVGIIILLAVFTNWI